MDQSQANATASNNSSSSNGESPRTPPPTLASKAITNPYPTTFIQADTSSFKQVVQMLTGSAETAAKHAAPPPTKSPLPRATGPKKPAFKLYERRSSMRNLKMISPLPPGLLGPGLRSPVAAAVGFSPHKKPEILSPSTLDFPSLALSPVTPLIPDPFRRAAALSAEDRAIAEKGFYLHPSPRKAPGDAHPPRLLPLFPVTSPRVSSASP